MSPSSPSLGVTTIQSCLQHRQTLAGIGTDTQFYFNQMSRERKHSFPNGRRKSGDTSKKRSITSASKTAMPHGKTFQAVNSRRTVFERLLRSQIGHGISIDSVPPPSTRPTRRTPVPPPSSRGGDTKEKQGNPTNPGGGTRKGCTARTDTAVRLDAVAAKRDGKSASTC